MELKKLMAAYIADRKRQRRLGALVGVLSVMVATGVFAGLMQPVVTMTPDPICGMAEHSHASGCYVQQMICGSEEDDTHTHGNDCYREVLSCPQTAHSHGDSCYPEKIPDVTIAPEITETEAPAVEYVPEQPMLTVPPLQPTEAPLEIATLAPELPLETEPAGNEETEQPQVARIENLRASAENVRVGDTVTFAFEITGAGNAGYAVLDESGDAVVQAVIDPSAQSISWRPVQPGRYTFRLTAEEAAAQCTVTVAEAQQAAAAIRADRLSCFAGQKVTFTAEVSGAEACRIEVWQDDVLIYESDSFTESIAVTPADIGRVTDITAKITATGADGSSAADETTIHCALYRRESRSEWERTVDIPLTGVWPEDLLSVAVTQLGYRESEVDFIVNASGKRQGYTRYGHWHGLEHEEWCAMFAAFCLHYADVPQSAFPRDPSCAKWVSDLKAAGLYAAVGTDGYAPAPGDLMFLDREDDGRIDHVGIITATDDEMLYTIEGNSGKAVSLGQYPLDDPMIAGYGALSSAYARYEEEQAETTLITLMADGAVVGEYTLPAGMPLGILPDAPEKEGYVFTGWYIAGTDQAAAAETVWTGSVVLEARYDVDEQCNVTFISDISDRTKDIAVKVPQGETLRSALGDQLPAAAAPEGLFFTAWIAPDGETTVTPETVILQDTEFTAQFISGVKLHYQHYDPTRFDGFAQAADAGAVEEILQYHYPGAALESPAEISVPDGWRVEGWYCRSGDESEILRAEPGMEILTETYFTVRYEPVAAMHIVLNDVGADGEVLGIEHISVPLPMRSSVTESMEGVLMEIDGAAAEELTWYTRSDDGGRVPYDPITELCDSEDSTELMLYTYSHELVLQMEAAPEQTTFLDWLFPTAHADSVTAGQNGWNVTLTVRENVPLTAADFVIGGVDYSLYQISETGKTVGETYIGKTIAQSETVAVSYTGSTAYRTVNFYAFVGGKCMTVASKTMQVYNTNSKMNLTAAQLETVYSAFGFKSSDVHVGKYSQFAQTNAGNDLVWLDSPATDDGNGVVFVPTLPGGDGRNIDVYYIPVSGGPDKDIIEDKINGEIYTNFMNSDSHWKISVADPGYVYHSESELPPARYVLDAHSVKFTLKKLPDGMNWTAGSVVMKQTDNLDGTVTIQIDRVLSEVVIKPDAEAIFMIHYNIGISSQHSVEGTRPQIVNGEDFTEAFSGIDGGKYIVRTPTHTMYNIVGTNSLKTVRFVGWRVNGSYSNIIKPGIELTAQELSAYGDNITLTGYWEDGDKHFSCSFYINLELQVADFDGSTQNTPDQNYTGAVFGTSVDIDPKPATSVFNYADVLQAQNQNQTAQIDSTIRKLAGGVEGTFVGQERTFTLGSFPDDEAVLSSVRDMQRGYITSFQKSAFFDPDDPYNVAEYRAQRDAKGNPINRIISQDGQYIPADELTSENYTVRWYVFKYDMTNGWHVDGVLVKKQGQLTVSKTFYGNDAAVNAVKNNYSITVSQNGKELYQLRLSNTSSGGNTGYADYNSATDTYTWTLPLSQNVEYTLKENNYKASAQVNIGGVNVPMASLAEYMVVNADEDELVSRRSYPDGGVQVSAKAYANDIPYSYFKTVRFYNSYIPTNTMLLSKVDDDGAPLANVTFQLRKGGAVQTVWEDADGVYYIYDPTATIPATPHADGRIVTDHLGNAMIIGLKDSRYAGDYELIELIAPAGYTKIDTPILFTVNADGSLQVPDTTYASLVDDLTIRVVNTSDTISITANKIWSDGTNTPVKVTLCKDGTPLPSTEVELNAANSWTHTWEGIPAYTGGQRANYSIRETWIGSTAYSGTIDDGYQDYVVTYSAPEYGFDDQGNPESMTLTVTNRLYSGGVEFTKVDEKGNALAGARFATYTLYTDQGCSNQYGSAQQSGQDGKVDFGFLAAGTYYLKEIAAPEGYILSDTVYKIVVSGGGTTITRMDDETGMPVTTIVNIPSSADVTLRKVDALGRPLNGAQFQLKQGGKLHVVNGTNSAGFTTAGSDATVTLRELPTSELEYTITERAAPDGYYRMSETIRFKVQAGDVELIGAAEGEQWSYDPQTRTFTVVNTPGVELPETGGTGAGQYRAAGIALMLTALAGWTAIRRRTRATEYRDNAARR